MTELRRLPSERRVKVVLADDDTPFAESLRVMVDEQPTLSVVGVAADGLEAIELVEQLEPEAVLMDLHMPLLDGVSAVARLRLDYPRLCLIAMTGDPAPELHQAVQEAGADAVLMKHELVLDVADHIAAARLERVAAF